MFHSAEANSTSNISCYFRLFSHLKEMAQKNAEARALFSLSEGEVVIQGKYPRRTSFTSLASFALLIFQRLSLQHLAGTSVCARKNMGTPYSLYPYYEPCALQFL